MSKITPTTPLRDVFSNPRHLLVYDEETTGFAGPVEPTDLDDEDRKLTVQEYAQAVVNEIHEEMEPWDQHEITVWVYDTPSPEYYLRSGIFHANDRENTLLVEVSATAFPTDLKE